MKTFLRKVPAGKSFILKRTNEQYKMLEIKQRTPNGTRYLVRKKDCSTNSTLHHSCHVVILENAE
jgi:hypothetical protein